MRSLSSLVADAERTAREREAVKAGWATWLRTLRWDYWATGTWERPVISHTAIRTVETWIGKLNTPTAYAAIGLQYGPTADKLHVHVLVGGVGRRALVATVLRRSWVRSGHMKVDLYLPFKEPNAVPYLVHQATEIELIGSPMEVRPRKRGRRGGAK